MAAPRVTKDAEPLRKHLEEKGAELVYTGGKTGTYAVIWHNERVARIPQKGKAWDPKRVINDIRRKAPELLEGYEGPGLHARTEPKPIEEEDRHRAPVTESAHLQRSNATRIRARQALIDHFEGKPRMLVDWAIEVGNENKMRIWSSTDSGYNSLHKWFSDENKTLSDWVLDLLDKALDAAYGTPEQPTPVIKRKQKPDSSASQFPRPTMQEIGRSPETVVIPDLEAQLEAAKRLLETSVKDRHSVEDQLEKVMAERDDLKRKLHEAAKNIATDEFVKETIRDRYIDILLKRVEGGDEAAMTHIERMIGLEG